MENREKELVSGLLKTIQNFSESNFKNDSYFIMFDKHDKPYILALPMDGTLTKRELEQEYIVYYEIYDGFSKQHIADLFMAFKENSSFLATIEILNQNYLRNNLGSQILRLYEYYSFIHGYNSVHGTVDCLNKEFIDKNKLKHFYKLNGYRIKKNVLQKNINVEEMKLFTKNMIRIHHGNAKYRILLPREIKNECMNVLNELKNNQLSVKTNQDLIF